MESFGKKNQMRQLDKRTSLFKIQELERSKNLYGSTQWDQQKKNYISCPKNPKYAYKCQICQSLGTLCPYRTKGNATNLCNHSSSNSHRVNVNFTNQNDKYIPTVNRSFQNIHYMIPIIRQQIIFYPVIYNRFITNPQQSGQNISLSRKTKMKRSDFMASTLADQPLTPQQLRQVWHYL